MPSNPADAWQQCLSIIKGTINPESFTTWFEPVRAVGLKNDHLTLEVPSHFFYEWLESHYRDLINQVLLEVVGTNAKVLYVNAKNGTNELSQIPILGKNNSSVNGADKKTNLNARYNFENFVEGSNNDFAKAAAFAVAKAPGKTAFNPLVVYGGVGLGKTHLIQAIGNFSLLRGRSRRVVYVDSEKFTVDFINSIQNNKTTEFSSIYRNVDILLVDDIQFFSGKEQTQEQFFHTFNTLHNSGKQIVLSSDKPPKQLKGLQERLISRFQWGLVVDIQPPDLETRIAILQQKALENEITLTGDIIEFIAANVTSNIRELEGALIRLLAYASLNNKDIDIEIAKDVLKNLSLKKKKNIVIEEIQRIVSAHFDMPDDLLRAKTRKKEIAQVRQIAMYLAKMMTNNSLKTIGLHFGGRDHSTVIHSVQLIEREIKKNKRTKELISDLVRKIELTCD